jgi:hypothetical protein
MYLYEKIEREKRRQKIEQDYYNMTHRDAVEPKKYVSLMSSMSHTYGNALAFIQNYVINLFPENTFKTIHVNSKIAHRQLRSTSKEFLKKLKPMIIFRPRIAARDEERFLQDTMFVERMNDIHSTWGGGPLLSFLEDPDNDFSIKYQLNRSVFYVDVILVFSTLMQQIDYVHYLQNALRWEHPFMLYTNMESFIPQEMLSIVSDISHVPLYDGHDCTYDFLTYMNGHSLYPITYKFNGASGSKEFYRYYPANIETTFNNLNWDEGDLNGSVANQYQIDFSIKMEFNSTGFYFLYSDDIYNINLPVINGEDTDIIPIYTDVLLAEDLHLKEGWILYNRATTKLENPDDTVNIDTLLNESVRNSIEYHLKNGLPLMDLVDLKVRKQGKLIHEGQEYDMDWNTKTITFHNQDEYHTYAIYICINLNNINQLVKAIYNLK